TVTRSPFPKSIRYPWSPDYFFPPMAATLSPHLNDEDLQARKGYDRRLVRRLLVYVRPYRALVAGALVLLMTEGLLQLVGPLLTERVIDVALPHRDAALAWR